MNMFISLWYYVMYLYHSYKSRHKLLLKLPIGWRSERHNQPLTILKVIAGEAWA